MERHNLEHRVARLERQNRLLLFGCLVLAALPLILGAGSQLQPKQGLPPGMQLPLQPLPRSFTKVVSPALQAEIAAQRLVHNVLKARLLCLVDSDGRTRATLSTDGAKNPTLALFDAQGILRTTMTLSTTGGMLEMLDRNETPSLRLGTAAERVRIAQVLEMTGPSRISMSHSNGTKVVGINGDETSASFELTHRNGTPSGRWGYRPVSGGTTEDRISTLELFSQRDGLSTTLFAGPNFVSVSTACKESKFHAQMSCQKSAAHISARAPRGTAVHQVFDTMTRLGESSDLVRIVDAGSTP
jgi:hypothetical protein